MRNGPRHQWRTISTTGGTRHDGHYLELRINLRVLNPPDVDPDDRLSTATRGDGTVRLQPGAARRKARTEVSRRSRRSRLPASARESPPRVRPVDRAQGDGHGRSCAAAVRRALWLRAGLIRARRGGRAPRGAARSRPARDRAQPNALVPGSRRRLASLRQQSRPDSGDGSSLLSVLLLLAMYAPFCLTLAPSLRCLYRPVLQFFTTLMAIVAVVAVVQMLLQLSGLVLFGSVGEVPQRGAHQGLQHDVPGGVRLHDREEQRLHLPGALVPVAVPRARVRRRTRHRARLWRLLLYFGAMLTTVSGTGVILLAFGLVVWLFKTRRIRGLPCSFCCSASPSS